MDKISLLKRIINELHDEDEVTIVELLGINTEQLIERFLDLIEERTDTLSRYFAIEDDEEEDLDN